MVNTYLNVPDSNQDPKSNQISRITEDVKQKYLKIILAITIITLFLLFITLSIFYWLNNSFYESTNNAYVTGNLVQITPQLVGTVTMIAADEGDFVKKGQLLVQLDPSMTRVVQESAEAHLAKIVRNVCSMHSQIDVGKQKVSMFQSKRKKARNNYQHNTHIFKHGKIALKKNGKLNSANNVLVSAPQQLDRTILRSDNIIKIIKHPDVKNAAAYLRRAYLKNQSSTIVAPVSGYVAKRSVQIGSYVIPGTTLMVVVPLDHVWIEANLKETQLLSIRIGQPVEIRTDLYGKNIVFHGKVESLGIGTGSAFSLLPAQNASGNWIKIVQRLPVRISLDPDNLDCYPLRIGLSTQVKIDIHNTNGPVLMPHSVNKIYSATEIYNSKLYEADMLVTRIIHENCTHFWD